MDRFFDSLVKEKVMVKSRTIGRAELYKLNKELPLVRKLIELDNFISKPLEKKV